MKHLLIYIFITLSRVLRWLLYCVKYKMRVIGENNRNVDFRCVWSDAYFLKPTANKYDLYRWDFLTKADCVARAIYFSSRVSRGRSSGLVVARSLWRSHRGKYYNKEEAVKHVMNSAYDVSDTATFVIVKT